MDKIVIKKTADGSDTIYDTALDESYHSINGAIQESNHIYINYGLKSCTKATIKLLEIGFGTGLNTDNTTVIFMR